MNTSQLGFNLAEQGATRAAGAADRKAPGWSERAAEMVLNHARGVNEFSIEDVRAVAAKTDLPAPPDNRAWGAVALRLKTAGKIIHLGYVTSKDASKHGAPVGRWALKLA